MHVFPSDLILARSSSYKHYMSLRHEKPNPALMAELNEVREKALALEDTYKSASNLPNQFPHEPLQFMLEALQKLPDGTAVESRPILHAADRRLARLRRQYFKHSPSDNNDAPDRHISGVERGQPLDAHAGDLKNVIGSALEECRIQEVGEDSPEGYDPWGYDGYDEEPDAEEIASLDYHAIRAQSEKLQTSLQSAKDDVHNILEPGSANGDRLKRVLSDTENLNLMNRAELKFPNGSSRIRRELNSRLRGTIPIIRKGIKSIQIGLDFAESVNDEWEKFKVNKGAFITTILRNFTNNIDEKLKQLDVPPPIPQVDPKIQKAAEAEAEELLKQNKPVPDALALNVRALNLALTNFTDTALLKNIKYLQSVDLDGTKIADISVLAHLPQLHRLWLNSTPVSDISVLAHLPQLHTLGLSSTPVSDISVLAHLPQLQWLGLNSTPVSDISVLAHLPQLHRLGLNSTPVSDISVLAHLPHLQRLGLRDTQVTDWGPVAHVKNVFGRPKGGNK